MWFLPCDCLKDFSLSLVLGNLIIMYLDVIFFMFLVLGAHWTSWICRFISFFKFGKFSSIISNFFFACSPPFPPTLSPTHSHTFPLGTSITHTVGYFKLSYGLSLLTSFFKFFLHFESLWIISISMLSSHLIILSVIYNLPLLTSNILGYFNIFHVSKFFRSRFIKYWSII